MKYRNALSACLLCISLSACLSSPQFQQPVSHLFCDNFLVYDMCAQDTDRDGTVELIYFSDTHDVFLYREGTQHQLPDGLAMHRCALPMDDDIVRNASQLFHIDDRTPYIQRVDIKSALMFSYVGYMPRVSKCNAQYESSQPKQPVGDEFDFEFEDF
ncbi:MAG: hypothetical protein RLZZ385_385 [Pseudomonadota bacterium]|jgi:hypothetical protein